MCTLDVEIISVAILHIYDYHNLIKWSDMSTSFFLFNKATIFVNNIHVFISHAVFLLFLTPGDKFNYGLPDHTQLWPMLHLSAPAWSVNCSHSHWRKDLCRVHLQYKSSLSLFPAECSDVRLSCVICRNDETTVHIRESDPACSNIHWSHMCAPAVVPTVLCRHALVIHQT